MSPTMLGTVVGQVMGTAGYMAPEQVRGESDIDGRADVFAFGCVLYEMVTGQRAFVGENVHDTLNKLLSASAPAARTIAAQVPERVDWILEKAMAKQPRDRYQSAADMSVDLRAAAARGESPAAEAADTLPPQRGRGGRTAFTEPAGSPPSRSSSSRWPQAPRWAGDSGLAIPTRKVRCFAANSSWRVGSAAELQSRALDRA